MTVLGCGADFKTQRCRNSAFLKTLSGVTCLTLLKKPRQIMRNSAGHSQRGQATTKISSGSKNPTVEILSVGKIFAFSYRSTPKSLIPSAACGAAQASLPEDKMMFAPRPRT
ncbi:MAG: hypothetical protein ONB48_04585 [candidate division KSB1 bacterium]|nr:hypothetical protein [candidate division KSB1 bacterium]MDZ7274412.1 hypothetical protein [candidate division KSB1 bacterium]MDZ7284926.1 hypothetical protein [candidate division KSB1 bacterium]MDZ7297653.1 hypothetical protein [candidate division KSB1 bacterium]MDZ7308614.1 hypothetical protein [candidate division KSB1 bacterium]